MISWMIVAVVVAIYCIARAIQDFRRKRYVWGACGAFSGACCS